MGDLFVLFFVFATLALLAHFWPGVLVALFGGLAAIVLVLDVGTWLGDVLRRAK